MSSTKQNNLEGVTEGLYLVTTESSAYLIDYDNKRAKRRPGPTAPEMRKDRDWFKFITVVAAVGGPMFIWTSDINNVEDTYTNRRTSDVVKIELLTECGL